MADWRDKKCHDCGCVHGELHMPGCDVERCPFCEGQLISCDCAVELLGLEGDEDVYENGLNDEQSERWEAMLKEKGLVPYQSPHQPGVADNVWIEFVHPDGHCSLCGNSGYINTLGKLRTAAGWRVGAKSYCICPNGRAMKRGEGKAEWCANPTGDSIIEHDARNVS